ITHVDTHGHTHMLPAVLDPVLAAAKACGVYCIRNPYDPLEFTVNDCMRVGARMTLRYGAVATLRRRAVDFCQRVAAAGMLTADGCVGVVFTGNLSERYFEQVMHALPEGTWELVCHPAH